MAKISEESVIQKGWCIKESTESFFGFKTWKRCYACIVNTVICYFDSIEDYKTFLDPSIVSMNEAFYEKTRKAVTEGQFDFTGSSLRVDENGAQKMGVKSTEPMLEMFSTNRIFRVFFEPPTPLAAWITTFRSILMAQESYMSGILKYLKLRDVVEDGELQMCNAMKMGSWSKCFVVLTFFHLLIFKSSSDNVPFLYIPVMADKFDQSPTEFSLRHVTPSSAITYMFKGLTGSGSEITKYVSGLIRIRSFLQSVVKRQELDAAMNPSQLFLYHQRTWSRSPSLNDMPSHVRSGQGSSLGAASGGSTTPMSMRSRQGSEVGSPMSSTFSTPYGTPLLSPTIATSPRQISLAASRQSPPPERGSSKSPEPGSNPSAKIPTNRQQTDVSAAAPEKPAFSPTSSTPLSLPPLVLASPPTPTETSTKSSSVPFSSQPQPESLQSSAALPRTVVPPSASSQKKPDSAPPQPQPSLPSAVSAQKQLAQAAAPILKNTSDSSSKDKPPEQKQPLFSDAALALKKQSAPTPPPPPPPPPEPSAEAKLLEEYRRKLTAGATFRKHGRQGKPHMRFVFVDFDDKTIAWSVEPGKRRGKGVSSMDSLVYAVIKGCQTDVFQRVKSKKRKPELCFSLIGSDRTLDLEADSERTRNLWVEMLEKVLVDKS